MDVGTTDATICHLDSYFAGMTFSILDISYISSSSIEEANVFSRSRHVVELNDPLVIETKSLHDAGLLVVSLTIASLVVLSIYRNFFCTLFILGSPPFDRGSPRGLIPDPSTAAKRI